MFFKDEKTALHYSSVYKKQLREPFWQLLLKSGVDTSLKDKVISQDKVITLSVIYAWVELRVMVTIANIKLFC